MEKKLILSSSPHVRTDENVKKIMWTVNASLLPAIAASVYYFGIRALALIGVSVAIAIITEAACQKLMKRPITATDGSAVLTGILLAFCVPASVPLWVVGVGAFFAIAIVKQAFGGLGYNIFNPALAGRAFLLAAYPVLMTTWMAPQEGLTTSQAALDRSYITVIEKQAPEIANEITAKSGATPLELIRSFRKNKQPEIIHYVTTSTVFRNLLIGRRGGCLGETSIICLLIGAAVLFFRRCITWHIPICYILTLFLFALILETLGGKNFRVPLYQIMSGGLILGAFFMATDMVTSPITPVGRILFGVGAGLFTVVIRYYSGPPEGVAYSILIMNAATPLIDRFTRPKVFGYVKPVKESS